MLTDQQARLFLKDLIQKYLKGSDPDYERLIEVVENPSRQVPIRGVLESIRRFNNAQLTESELELIRELLYMFG
jgi:hypothetical protein